MTKARVFAKPRIHMHRHRIPGEDNWVCWAPASTIGIGNSPQAAYDDWLYQHSLLVRFLIQLKF